MELFEKNENMDHKKAADVTVIVTTKNRFELLIRALASISRQSQLPFEILIMNNGNRFTADEENCIQRACELISRVRIVNAQQLTDVSSCRELGLQMTSSGFATYLDDDNIMWPNWIENAFEFISEGDLSFIYGAQLREDYELRYFHQVFTQEKIRSDNLIDTNSIMHKSRLGRWTPGVSRLSDWSFILNFISDNPQEEIIPLNAISTIYKVDAPDRITTSLYSPYKVLIGLLHELIHDSKIVLNLEKVYCIICSSMNILTDGPNGRESATCPNCGSLERHRVLKMLLELIAQHLTKNQEIGKVIEVAPSTVSRSIFTVFGSNYQSFDFNPSADGRDCDFVADICDIPLEDNSVSLFVALHVLEHVQNDRLALKEISRVLKPSGVCLLQVPLGTPSQSTQEGLIEDDLERIARYGQIDHVRMYGEDIIERIQESGMLATFISVEDLFPDFLISALGLRDGMKFIFSMRNENSFSASNFAEFIKMLQSDYKRLEIFCNLIEERIKQM